MQFLAPNALAFVQSTLGSTYSESLGPAAIWPDEVKYDSGWTWSQPLHFINALDDPPTSCSVVASRDCSGTNVCTLSAIANYTTQVVDTSLSSTLIQDALKFLDHFIGDITQPLHVENYEEGGNDIDTTCAGESTNLHATWDTGMIEQLLSDEYDDSVETWADTLVTRIQTGEYESLASSWISCSSTDASDACPLVWAQDSNTFDCTVIFNYTSGQDLCSSSYYTYAVPVIELQIAKGGYRLAAWLNVLFDGATNLP